MSLLLLFTAHYIPLNFRIYRSLADHYIAHAEAAAALKLATWPSTAYSVVLLVNLQLMLMLLLLLRRISREGYNEGGATRLIHCLLSISIIYIELIQFNSNQFLAHYYHHHHFIRSIDDRSSFMESSQ